MRNKRLNMQMLANDAHRSAARTPLANADNKLRKEGRRDPGTSADICPSNPVLLEAQRPRSKMDHQRYTYSKKQSNSIPKRPLKKVFPNGRVGNQKGQSITLVVVLAQYDPLNQGASPYGRIRHPGQRAPSLSFSAPSLSGLGITYPANPPVRTS